MKVTMFHFMPYRDLPADFPPKGLASSWIDTPWWDFLPADVKQGVFADFGRQILVGRIGRAQEVADTVRFVLENEYINGTVIGCHGGI